MKAGAVLLGSIITGGFLLGSQIMQSSSTQSTEKMQLEFEAKSQRTATQRALYTRFAHLVSRAFATRFPIEQGPIWRPSDSAELDLIVQDILLSATRETAEAALHLQQLSDKFMRARRPVEEPPPVYDLEEIIHAWHQFRNAARRELGATGELPEPH